MPKRYPEEFRRKVLDLFAAGKPVAQVAADLGISDQTIYAWRTQERIDTGQAPGIARGEQSAAGGIRIGGTTRGGVDRLRSVLCDMPGSPTRSGASMRIARLLEVSTSGYYQYVKRRAATVF